MRRWSEESKTSLVGLLLAVAIIFAGLIVQQLHAQPTGLVQPGHDVLEQLHPGASRKASAYNLPQKYSEVEYAVAAYGVAHVPAGMFWAYKMHFFITGVSFYNFPYVFGYLLSQALFARFKAEGAAFLPRYEAFLSMTGSATCEEVVKQTLGEDLTQPEFWATALKAMEPSLAAYEALKI